MTELRQSDVRHAHYMLLVKRSVVVADRGHQDFAMLYDWDKSDIYFVSRLKKSINHKMLRELPLSENDNGKVLKDELIELTEEESKAHSLKQ